MAYSLFQENKIIKVCTGKLSRTLNKSTTFNANEGRASATYYQNTISIPARFKIYVHQLKLSKACENYIKKHLAGDVFITLKWLLFSFEDHITSPGKLEHNKTKFDFTIKHQLEVDEDFMSKIYATPIVFKLFARCSGSMIFLSEVQFYIDNIIEVVNIKQNQRLFFASSAIDPKGENIAYLDIWYKFTCKQKTLRSLFPTTRDVVKKKPSAKIPDLLCDKFLKRSQNFTSVHVSDSEFDQFADSVLLVLNRNKVLRTTQSDINLMLQERVRWLRFEANWKQTLQENAILHGKNPEKVIWRQWREEDTTNVRLRTYDNIVPKTYPRKLIITVVDLYFLEGSSVLKNESVRQFFIEYSFLGREGPEMESPYSLAKAKPEERIVFNFSKKFHIDMKTNFEDCEMLADLIKHDDIIKFTVISEPLESEEKPIQTCTAVGYAEVPFSELIQVEENIDTDEYEIVDINNINIVVGYMTIKFEGILAMRKMALDLMAPHGYKLYV